MIILGRIKDGHIQVQRFFKKDLVRCDGKEVEIRPVENDRTTRQNNYLWGVVYKLASEHTGFTPLEVHEVFKRRFLTYEKSYQDKLYEFTKSTTELTTREFADYVDEVRRYCEAELGLLIPDPEIVYDD